MTRARPRVLITDHCFSLQNAQVTKKMDKKKQEKRSKCKTFIKNINYSHLMPTRYTLDVDFKDTVTPDALENATKKLAAQKEARSSSRNDSRLASPAGSSLASPSKRCAKKK